MESKVIIPYSQHHRDYAMMIGSVANQAVFETLMDEYLVRMKTGRALTDIPYQVNRIARARNLSWRTVKNAMDSLVTMKLITFDQTCYTLDGDMYMSLIMTFNQLTFIEKEEFAKLLSKGKFDELQKMGFQLIENSCMEMLKMRGSLDASEENPMQNVRDLLKTTETSEKSQKPLQNVRGFLKMSEGSDIFNRYLQIFSSKTADLDLNLCKMSEGSDIFNTPLGQSLEEILPRELILRRISDILQNFGENADEALVNLCFFAEIASDILHRGPLTFLRGASDIFKNSNKINKNKKEKVEEQSSSLKRKEQDSFFEQDELDFNIPEQDEQDEPLDFQVDTNMMGNALNKYQLYKKKQRLPYFPVSTVQDLTTDIRNCLDRADKLFIFQVWTILHELFDQDEYQDDDGNLIVADNNVEGSAIVKERLEKDILFPALEQTLAILESGIIEVNGEELEVTAQSIPEEYYNLIIDWEIKTMLDGESYIVSASRLHDIYAEQLPEKTENIKTGRGNENGREDDYTYMKKITIIGADDELYTQLTPIELAVYNFIIDNFQLNDSNEIVEPNQSFLPERSFRIFLAEIKQKGITQQEFVGVIFNNKLDEGGISLRNRMFSAAKIRNWNAKHSLESIVDSYEFNQS